MLGIPSSRPREQSSRRSVSLRPSTGRCDTAHQTLDQASPSWEIENRTVVKFESIHVGQARPSDCCRHRASLRVAYLVDLSNSAAELLDSIFAEAYGRWSGRRSLIVPAGPDGIDDRYDEWLWYFDPDLIYSFLALTDRAVAALHERFAPAYLTHHAEPGI